MTNYLIQVCGKYLLGSTLYVTGTSVNGHLTNNVKISIPKVINGLSNSISKCQINHSYSFI